MKNKVFAVLIASGLLVSTAFAAEPRRGAKPLEKTTERIEKLVKAQKAADPIARAFALALKDAAVRTQLRDAMRDSSLTEHKLELQPFAGTAAGRRLVAGAAKAGGFDSHDLADRIKALPNLDLYLPFGEHRTTWKATPDLLVAAVYDLDAPEIVAYDLQGRPHTLYLVDGTPARPLLLLQLAERKSVVQRPASRGEVVEAPGELRLIEKASSGYTSQSGYFLYHYNIQEGDGWGGSLEMEFRSYYHDNFSSDSPVWTVVRNGVTEDVGYNVNILLIPLPGSYSIGDQFVMEIWEMDGGLNGGNDDYGRNYYPPSALNTIIEYRKFNTFSGTTRSAWIGINRRQFAYSGTTGNPFEYPSARDQYLACYGIAGRVSSNCFDISDFNDKQMCYGMSDSTQAPCASMTDRNLQLACYGMSIDYSSNCFDITDPNLRQFCYGVSNNDRTQCSSVQESNAWILCQAMATGNDAFCDSITNSNDWRFCLAVTTHNNAYCAAIQ